MRRSALFVTALAFGTSVVAQTTPAASPTTTADVTTVSQIRANLEDSCKQNAECAATVTFVNGTAVIIAPRPVSTQSLLAAKLQLWREHYGTKPQ